MNDVRSPRRQRMVGELATEAAEKSEASTLFHRPVTQGTRGRALHQKELGRRTRTDDGAVVKEVGRLDAVAAEGRW